MRTMAEININCPHCGEPAKAPAEFAGKSAECPSCGKEFQIPAAVPSPPPPLPKRPAPAPRQAQLKTETSDVVVTDIKMPFGSMVVFMIKWTLAAIPALIILAILGFIASLVFMSGCAALMMGAK
jgi:hypothetical protein